MNSRVTIRAATAALLLAVLSLGSAAAPAPRRAAGVNPIRARDAQTALFVDSDLPVARQRAAAVLKRSPADIDALFVEMEAAALEADTAAELDAALRLCEAPRARHDARATIAAARILDRAGNTGEFRAAVPRIQRLVAADIPQTNYLRAALVAAAADGVPGLSALDLARQSGLVTDWRVAGPFGRYPNVAFDRKFLPERDGLTETSYDGRAAEEFRFDDGNFVLPEYSSTAGIFYAASDVRIPRAGEWRVRAETAGTLEVFLDGISVLRKDDRYRATPEIDWRAVRLSAGQHRLLVKFPPSAAPFRIAVLPRHAAPSTAAARAVAFAPEAAYIGAAEAYWTGDYSGAAAQLTVAATSGGPASGAVGSKAARRTAVVGFLLAQAWSHLAPESPEEPALLSAVLDTAPSAWAAEYARAERAFNDDHFEDASRLLRRVVAARPQFAPAQRLLAESAVALNWQPEAAQAYDALVRLHPSCSALRSASRFFASVAEYDTAARLLGQLEACAPASATFAQALSDSGRHAEAAAAAAKLVAARPLNRDARALLVSELAQSGQTQAARTAADELVKIAPNSARFAHMAAQIQTASIVFDHVSDRGADFGGERQFYTAYRRDGPRLVKDTANRRFSGGPAVMLLNDRVARIAPDGNVSLYVHKLMRVLDRDGIEKYGEVTVPRSASLLELRTLKADGAIVEPEFNQHKTSISMPALAAGDVIEQEYVLHYAAGAAAEHRDALQFTFGSFTAPILYSRFVVLAPARQPLDIVNAGDVPAFTTNRTAGELVRVWERDNIAQSSDEVSAPRTDVLPTVRVLRRRPGGWLDLRDAYRDQLIDAVRIGARVEQTTRQLRGAGPRETARALYRFVTQRIRSTQSSFDGADVAPAERTLGNYSGSRTAAVLALARAAGLDADLLLGRDMGRQRPKTPMRDVYTHPLVLFTFTAADGTRDQVVVDAETDGLAFGAVPPTVARADALLVPLHAPGADAELFAQVPAITVGEQSVADGDVTIDGHGELSATVTIRMGSTRGAQMRAILAGIEPGERKHFFEQLAMRIFPGTADADGEVRSEFDPDRPLELLLHCRAPHFVNFAGATTEIEQLVPTLGLRKMYVGAGTRKLPLYVDVPLFETTTFRVRLPAGVRVTAPASDLRVQNEFGAYSVEFRQLAAERLEIRRVFEIPVQVIPAARFDAFSRFARQIDDAERQRITLGYTATTARK